MAKKTERCFIGMIPFLVNGFIFFPETPDKIELQKPAYRQGKNPFG
jgi:hypothetical protein